MEAVGEAEDSGENVFVGGVVALEEVESLLVVSGTAVRHRR